MEMDSVNHKKPFASILLGLMVSCAAALLLWLFVYVKVYGLSLYEAAGATSFILFYTLLCISAVVLAIWYARAGLFAKGLVWLGICMILLQGMLLTGFGFEGVAVVGEGETTERVELTGRGRWANTPLLPLSLLSAKTSVSESGSRESCLVLLDGRQLEIEMGGKTTWNGLRLTLENISTAPLFILGNLKGDELEAGYVKIDWTMPGEAFFQFRIVPHRFYVSLPDAVHEVWVRDGKSWRLRDHAEPKKDVRPPVTMPEKLRIKIVRGKLTITDKTVSMGEHINFDGHSLVFREGVRWAIFTVTKDQPYYLLYIGTAAILFGGAMMILSARRGV